MRFLVSRPEAGYARSRARQLRKALTPAEQRLWEHLRRGSVHGLRFRRQQAIGPYIIDFYCHRLRLAVEVDGSVHDQQRGYDALRDAFLRRWGISTIRFANEQIFDRIEEVVALIRGMAGRDATERADQDRAVSPNADVLSTASPSPASPSGRRPSGEEPGDSATDS